MKKLVSNRVAVACLSATLAIALQGQTWAASFSDVPTSYWADKYIDYLSARQIVTGYPDQSFRPNQAVTRAEFAAMLAKSQNLPTNSRRSIFNDVPSSHWAAGAIQAVVDKGWIAGYPGNMYLPNQPISLAEMYTIVAKSSGRPLVSATDAETILKSFNDAASTPVWARPSVATAVKYGMTVNELYRNDISPNVNATRASVATSLAKLINSDFRFPTDVATTPTQPSLDLTGVLQPTPNVGEWVLVTDDNKPYYLKNIGALAQQPWFKVGSRVHLLGNPDTTASTSQRQFVQITTLDPLQSTQNLITLNGTLRPSAVSSGNWLLVTSDNRTYPILNTQQLTSNPYFKFGSNVSLQGNLRPDISSTEGTPIFVSQVNASTISQQLVINGTLYPTTEAGGWYIKDDATGAKYVLLGTTPTDQQWFTTGSKIRVTGNLRSDIPTIYMEGPVLNVSQITQDPRNATGPQTVALYYPNLTQLVSNPVTMIGAPVQHTLQGPDVPRKAVETLLQAPPAMYQVRGYFQDEDIRQLTLNKLDMTADGRATVTLQAPANFRFKNNTSAIRLNESLTKTLQQFDVNQVNIRLVDPAGNVVPLS